MELKYLYTVKKIVETGSYQKAASALNYAPSTITFQVKQVEQELSLKLFERNEKRMVLSQAGRDMFPLIDKVIEAAEELLAQKEASNEMKGSLKIALPESLITYKMQPVLQRFKEMAPQVRLSLQVMNCYSIHQQMLEGSIDLAIHYDVRKYPSAIKTKSIDTFPLALIASADLPQSEEDFVTTNQKKAVCHIQNDSHAFYLKLFTNYLKEKNIVMETELELWSIESVKRSVASNLGVALLPRFTVEQELAEGAVKEIPLALSEPVCPVIYAYHSNRWISPALKLFMELMDAFFRQSSVGK